MADAWTQVTGEAGRVYYLNNTTGETSWLKPAGAKVAEAPLPDGWVEKKARAGNKVLLQPRHGRDVIRSTRAERGPGGDRQGGS